MVDDQSLAVGAGDLEVLVVQVEFARLGVVHVSGPAADSGADVVPGPEGSEVIAADRQLPDQLVEQRVIDLRAEQRAHARDCVVCKRLPLVAVEGTDGGVQEGRAQLVHARVNCGERAVARGLAASTSSRRP